MAAARAPDLVVLDLMLPRRRRARGDAPHPRERWPAHSRSSCSPPRARSPTASSACGSAPTTTSSSRSRPAELVARVDAVLRRIDTVGDAASRRCASASSRSIRRRGGCSVDGEEVALTQREFDLLLFLARHPGQAFTRNQLMDHVWQYSFYTDTSTVTVHIRRLRAKLEADPERPRWIETVWGVGYRFAAVRRLPAASASRSRPPAVAMVALVGYGDDAALATLKILAPLGCGAVLVATRWRARGARWAACAASSRSSPWSAMVQLTAAVVLFVGQMFVSAPRRVLRRARRGLRRRAGRCGPCACSGAGAIATSTRSRTTLALVGERPTRRAHRRRRTRRARPPGGRRRRDGRAARQRGARATRPDRRRLARPAHPDHRRCGCWPTRSTTGSSTPRTAATTRRACGTHVRALGALIDDLFELTRLESGELTWTHGAGAARRCCCTRRSRRCARPPTPRP